MSREAVLNYFLRTRTKRSRELVILENRGLVHSICNRMKVSRDLHDDAFAAGMIGLCRAVDMFDADKGEWASFVGFWVRAEIKDWIEREVRQSRCASITEKSRKGTVANNRVYLSDDAFADAAESPTVNPSDFAEERSDLESLRAALSRMTLTPRERRIIEQNMIGDVSIAELAAADGVSRQIYNLNRMNLVSRLRREVGCETA